MTQSCRSRCHTCLSRRTRVGKRSDRHVIVLMMTAAWNRQARASLAGGLLGAISPVLSTSPPDTVVLVGRVEPFARRYDNGSTRGVSISLAIPIPAKPPPPCCFPGLYGISGASLVGCDAPQLMSALGSSGVGPAVKLAVSFPLVYHYLGAVRHTVSDLTGRPAYGTALPLRVSCSAANMARRDLPKILTLRLKNKIS